MLIMDTIGTPYGCAKDYAKDGVDFYLKEDNDRIIPIGTDLFHVGSLLGQMGANSMTTYYFTSWKNFINLSTSTTVTAFPKFAGVYLQNGQYVGMIVRGAVKDLI